MPVETNSYPEMAGGLFLDVVKFTGRAMEQQRA